MPSKDSFDYKSTGPITEDGCAFRLVRLFGGNSPTIECELFKAGFDFIDGENQYVIPYDALSYVWGTSKTTEPIILNQKSYLVTPNLLVALQNLRREDEDRILWIDAICIDQGSHKEKNHQLLLMASIYKQANTVIFWLGPATYETDLLLGALKRLQNRAVRTACKDWRAGDSRWAEPWSLVVPDSLLYPEYTSALRYMLERPWFQRVWILQECAHARRAEVTCGKKQVSARIFALAPSLLGIDPEAHCQAVLDIMPGASREGWWRQQRDLFTLLRKFQNSEASNPRDNIYALLSMATDIEEKTFPAIDYGLSLKEVLSRTSSFLFPYQWKISTITTEYETFSAFAMDLYRLNNQEIMLAVGDGACPTLTQLTSRTGPNFRDLRGSTALAEAAQHGHLEAARLLLAIEDIDVNARDKQQRTPLMKAAQNGHIGIVDLLLEAPLIIPDDKDLEGRTALAQAAAHGHTGIVKLLLQKADVDMNTKDKQQHTPLLQAIRQGHTQVACTLLDHIDTTEIECSHVEYTLDPMYWAVQLKQGTVVGLLLIRRSQKADFVEANVKEIALLSIELNDADLFHALVRLGRTTFEDIMGMSSLIPAYDLDSRYTLLPTMLSGSSPGDLNRRDCIGECLVVWAIRRRKYDLALELVKIPGMNLNHVELGLRELNSLDCKWPPESVVVEIDGQKVIKRLTGLDTQWISSWQVP